MPDIKFNCYLIQKDCLEKKLSPDRLTRTTNMFVKMAVAGLVSYYYVKIFS